MATRDSKERTLAKEGRKNTRLARCRFIKEREMYVISGVVVLVLIIGFALYINHLKETHSSEIRKQKEEFTKKLRDEVDKVYIKMRDEKTNSF